MALDTGKTFPDEPVALLYRGQRHELGSFVLSPEWKRNLAGLLRAAAEYLEDDDG